MEPGTGDDPEGDQRGGRDRRNEGGDSGRSKGLRDFGAAPPSLGTVAYIVFLCLLWGGNMVAMKISLEGVPPLSAAGFRFLLGSISLLLFAIARRVPLVVDRALWPHLIALGGLFVIQHGVFYLGLNLTSASRSVVFMFTQPVYTVLLAHFLVPGERLTRSRAAGILLSILGLLLVFGEGLRGGSWAMLLGDGMVTVGALGWALQNVYMKHLLHRADPFMLTLYQMVIAFPCLLLANQILEPRLIHFMSTRIALSFLYHGSLVAGLTFVAWTILLRRHQVGHLSAFTFLTPIFGVCLSWLMLGDPATPSLIGGLVLVATGVAVVNRPDQPSGADFRR